MQGVFASLFTDARANQTWACGALAVEQHPGPRGVFPSAHCRVTGGGLCGAGFTQAGALAALGSPASFELTAWWVQLPGSVS